MCSYGYGFVIFAGQVFEGHTHYVMQIIINPKDNNQFASASLDRTIKVHKFMFSILYLQGWPSSGARGDVTPKYFQT